MKVLLIALIALAVCLSPTRGQDRQSFYLCQVTVPTTEILVPENRQGSCATKFKNLYLSKNVQTDWMGAYAFCKGINMKLVSLRDQSEWRQFAQLSVSHMSNFLAAAHIGGSRGNDNSWVWFDNGQRINYTIPWFTGEPNNLANENCLEVGFRDGKFGVNDRICSGFSKQFICETSYRYNCIYW